MLQQCSLSLAALQLLISAFQLLLKRSLVSGDGRHGLLILSELLQLHLQEPLLGYVSAELQFGLGQLPTLVYLSLFQLPHLLRLADTALIANHALLM